MKSTMSKRKYTKIFFRILPEEKMNWDCVKILDDNKTIYVRSLQQPSKSTEQAVPTFWTFHVDNVFFNHTQTTIYNAIVPEVLDGITEGQDAVIMSYGQTGTGKSLTINGLTYTFEERGILPRIAADLFISIKKEAAKHHIKLCIQVSYVEFSKTAVYDLLKSYPNNVSSLKQITKLKIRNFEEALRIIFRGEGRKLYSENSPYPSHNCTSIFTFYVGAKYTDMQDDGVHKAKLHIVDLAGADTVGNFSCLFKNAQDVGTGNLAKTQLEQFLLTVSTDIPELIKTKQRLNSMILYLGDSLRKSSLFRIIGHIRVSREDLLITISMLRFGELIGGLKVNKYQMNLVTGRHISQSRLENLEKELVKLKLQSKHNATFIEQNLSKSLNDERLAHIERTVNEYLQDKITQVTLTNVCDVNIVLEVLKMIYKKFTEHSVTTSISSGKKLSAASVNKTQHRGSKGSHKTATSSETSTRKRLEEKSHSEKLRSSLGSADLKRLSKEKAPPLHAPAQARSKSKGSISSLNKRPPTGKRKSGSSLSLTRSKSKSIKSFEETFMPEIPPEFSEAWSAYVSEKHEEYSRLLDAYKKNEAAAKAAYKIYTFELEKLKQTLSEVEKHKHHLLLAKMTADFQRVDSHPPINGQVELTDFQKCCMEYLQRDEGKKVLKQESVLKYQAELKAHINVCNDMKKDLNDSFDAFCKEKYHTSILNLHAEEVIAVDVLESLDKEEKVEQELIIPENPHAVLFENCKALIEIEKRKRKAYLIKRREWVTY